MAFDARMPEILDQMAEDDLLIITADHAWKRSDSTGNGSHA